MSANNSLKSTTSNKGIGMAIGLVFGGLVGLLIGNPIVFAGGGLVLGLSVGYALDRKNSE